MKASYEGLQPASGPYDRADLAYRTIGRVFVKLHQEAEGRNGRLTVDDLRELELYLREAQRGMLDVRGGADGFCLPFSRGRNGIELDKSNLLVSVVGACLGDIVQTVFAGQLDLGGDHWRSEVLEFLADLLRQVATGDIDEQLYQIYCELALWKGQELSARDIASDARVVEIVRDLLRAVACKRKDGSLSASSLCYEFNRRIETGMPRLDVGLEFVTAAQVNKLLESLDPTEIDRPG